MHRTHLPLLVWAQAIYLIVASSKGISAVKMAQMLGVSYEAAWHLGHRIRAMMAEQNMQLAGIVEIDETYAGAPPRRKRDPAQLRARSSRPSCRTSPSGSASLSPRSTRPRLIKRRESRTSPFAPQFLMCAKGKINVLL
jgi:hypothetical protein